MIVALQIPGCFSRHHVSFTPDLVALARARVDEVSDSLRALGGRVGLPAPLSVFVQGSLALGSAVRYADGFSDVDCGVVFDRLALSDALREAMCLKERIHQVLERANLGSDVSVQPHCVRVHDRGGLDIDVPIYIERDSPVGPPLQIAGLIDWEPADPVGVTAWFQQQARVYTPCLGRLLAKVKYELRWFGGNDLPEGLAITALTCEALRQRSPGGHWTLAEMIEALRLEVGKSQTVLHPVLRTPLDVSYSSLNALRSALYETAVYLSDRGQSTTLLA